MKITKRQLRGLIRGSLQLETTSHERETGLPSEFVEDNWLPWLEERGLGAEDLDDLARFTGAPDRSWLPATPPADGMVGPADIEKWARYKKTGIKEGKIKITKNQIRRIIKEEKAKVLAEQSLLDLDDYKMLENAVLGAIESLVIMGYTREDAVQALQMIAMDAK